MNSFGRLFRISMLGESHGSAVGVLIDGCPAGLELKESLWAEDLERRRGGQSVGTTARKEEDKPRIVSGIFNERTTGAPLLITFDNKDVRSSDYGSLQKTPRPGHSDFTAQLKFGGFNDYRGRGHFSGRLTTGLVVAGAIAKALLQPISIRSEVLEVGGSKEIDPAVKAVREEGDSLGGLVECRVTGMPAGLGEPFFDSVESLISHAVFSIPAIKGIEFGSGFKCAAMRGSECNDAILDKSGKTATNHAGGILGGITNGAQLYFRVAVKPTSSIKKTQDSVNLRSGEAVKLSVEGRHDACIALRVPVVLEAVTAITLIDLMLLEQKMKRVVGSDGSQRN